jgi:RNA polymerase sigma-70 factor (TIGR02960 family)
LGHERRDTGGAANGTAHLTVPGNPKDAGTLARAREGDDAAFRELTDPYRAELQVHCYRILGSLHDAEDAVQDTLLAAWRGLAKFEARASVRSWLYRIATNTCLNALRARSRRPRRVQAMDDVPAPTRTIEPTWIEPYPDALLDELPDRAPGPAARYESREAVELAFIVTLQGLPPRQRAVLVLRDVLGFRTAEAAEMLGTGEGSVKGALQRARATLRSAGERDRAPEPSSPRERELVGRFADAVESGDVDDIVALLTDDARLTMPPQPLEYQGHAAIAAFLRHRAELRGAPLRAVPTRANSQPAFGCYLPDAHGARPYGLIVLTLGRDAITAITWFADTSVFPGLGLPPRLQGSGAG